MLQESDKKKIVKELLESPEFKDSLRYRELLEYLFNAALSGNVPKEITIGTEFFRKDPTFDPKEDPTVRVYLTHLRKKLDHYYLTSDVPHAYRLEIPKGHYQVEFVKADKKPQKAASPTLSRAAILVSGIAILAVIGFSVRTLLKASELQTMKADPIWRDFVKPGGRPTLIVLGDFFFLFERTADGKTRNFVRNIDVNSLDDFKEFVKRDPKVASHYVQSDFTFLRPSASWGLAQILPVLQQSPNGVSLKLASEFNVADLKSNNIVFLGSFKTLYSLHKFLHIFGLDYAFNPSRFELRTPDSDSVRVFAPREIKGGNYEKDFALVAKGMGPDGSTLLLLLGFADSGVIEAAKAVTDSEMVSTITKDLVGHQASEPFNFTLVVETEGFKQAIFKSRIQYFTRSHPLSQKAAAALPDSSVRN